MFFRLCATVLHLSLISPVESQIAFKETNFQEAVGEAEEKGKLVYVFATNSYCISCDEMEAAVFSDSLISKVLDESFITLKLDLESDFGTKFAMKYRISKTPAHLFFDRQGHLIRRKDGVLNSDPLLKLILQARYADVEYDPLKEPMNFDLDFPEWYIDFRKPPNERVYPTNTEIKTFLESRDSITDEVTWAIIYTLTTPEEFVGRIIENKEKLSDRYGRDEVLEKLSSYVYHDVKQAIKNQSESLLYEAMRKANRLLGEDAESYKLRYQLYYYQMMGNWTVYADLGVELSRNLSLWEPTWLNDIATNIYRNTTNAEALNKAAKWMEGVTEIKPNYLHYSTSALIQQQLHNKTEAIEFANKAIESANHSKVDISEMRNLISRIKE